MINKEELKKFDWVVFGGRFTLVYRNPILAAQMVEGSASSTMVKVPKGLVKNGNVR